MTEAPDQLFIDLQEALVGKYSLDMELGRGGMGVVYLARDVRLDRPVALKVLPDHLATRPEVRDRFLREARTAAKLSHPNIVPIHAVEEAGRFVFFAMSYIAGETLGERVRRRGPVAPSVCMQVLKEVGFALSYAHSQGVIHRDIKPDNILLEEGSGRALVADFGIAGLQEAGEATGVGEIIGTAEFMSPEHAAGHGVDARSDIYALGMVALYSLTGELPFPPGDSKQTLQLVRSGPELTATAVAPAAPRRLTRLADQCLKRDPDERFQTAEQLANAVDSVESVRRQVPVAVRNFLYDPIDFGGDGPAYLAMGGMIYLPALSVMLLEPGAGLAMLLVWTIYFVGAPLVLVPPRIRRLLKTGNGIDDLEVGLKQDLEQRRDEAPPDRPTRWTRIQRWLRKVGLGGMATAWLALWGTMLASEAGLIGLVEGLIYALGSGTMIGSVGLFLLGSVNAGDRDAAELRKAQRRLKFWRGKFGRFLFKLCGRGLQARLTEVRATHRPTELQIGLAAEALYQQLPPELQKSVGDVPAMVNRLEDDATQLRESIEQLREAEASGLPLNMTLPTDLRDTKRDAERKLSDVMTALETIRLGLLRLSTGGGSVESLTTHLHAAEQVGEQVSLLMGGLREVESALSSSGDLGLAPGS